MSEVVTAATLIAQLCKVDPATPIVIAVTAPTCEPIYPALIPQGVTIPKGSPYAVLVCFTDRAASLT